MDDEDGIFWLVDGEERPFEPAGRGARPWLEESVEWGRDAERGQRPPAAPPKDDSSQVVWL